MTCPGESPGRRRMAVGRIQALEAAQIQSGFRRNRLQPGRRPDQHRVDQTVLAGLQRGRQGECIAGVDDGGADGRQPGHPAHQITEPLGG